MHTQTQTQTLRQTLTQLYIMLSSYAYIVSFSLNSIAFFFLTVIFKEPKECVDTESQFEWLNILGIKRNFYFRFHSFGRLTVDRLFSLTNFGLFFIP